MNQSDVERFARGIELKDFTCHPAQLKIVELDEEKEISRRNYPSWKASSTKLSAWWLPVEKKLRISQRLSMGPLQLDPELALGEWRRLTEEEMKSLERFQVEL